MRQIIFKPQLYNEMIFKLIQAKLFNFYFEPQESPYVEILETRNFINNI